LLLDRPPYCRDGRYGAGRQMSAAAGLALFSPYPEL